MIASEFFGIMFLLVGALCIAIAFIGTLISLGQLFMRLLDERPWWWQVSAWGILGILLFTSGYFLVRL